MGRGARAVLRALLAVGTLALLGRRIANQRALASGAIDTVARFEAVLALAARAADAVETGVVADAAALAGAAVAARRALRWRAASWQADLRGSVAHQIGVTHALLARAVGAAVVGEAATAKTLEVGGRASVGARAGAERLAGGALLARARLRAGARREAGAADTLARQESARVGRSASTERRRRGLDTDGVGRRGRSRRGGRRADVERADAVVGAGLTRGTGAIGGAEIARELIGAGEFEVGLLAKHARSLLVAVDARVAGERNRDGELVGFALLDAFRDPFLRQRGRHAKRELRRWIGDAAQFAQIGV